MSNTHTLFGLSRPFKFVAAILVLLMCWVAYIQLSSIIRTQMGTEESAIIIRKEVQSGNSVSRSDDFEYRYKITTGQYNGEEYEARSYTQYENGESIIVKVSKDGESSYIDAWNYDLVFALTFFGIAITTIAGTVGYFVYKSKQRAR